MTILLLTGCGAESRIEKAHKLEDKGKYYDAWQAYQDFAASYPKHERAAEALFRAGLVAQKGLNDCDVAMHFYDDVLARYPQADYWARAASVQRLNCPDYFPLIPGSKWTEVDSDTKGSIAKTVIECEKDENDRNDYPSQSGELIRSFYAGNKQFKKTRSLYRKEGEQLLEFQNQSDTSPKIILRWPLKEGTAWRTRESGRILRFEIIGTDQSVKVQAGEFSDCLKVRSDIEGVKGARYEYYAPGVGKILTTLASEQGEKRNTELQSFEIAKRSDFRMPGKEPKE